MRAAAHLAAAAVRAGCWTGHSAPPLLTVPVQKQPAACVPVLPGQMGPVLHTRNIMLSRDVEACRKQNCLATVNEIP